MTLVHGQAVAVLGGATQRVDVGDVEHRVHALGEQVHRQRDDVDVAGALTVAEQGALDAVRPCQHAELGRRDGGAPVVVGVQRQHDLVAVGQVAVHVLDDVGVQVRGVHRDGRRQVQDHLLVRAQLERVHDGRTDLDGVLRFGAGEGLG